MARLQLALNVDNFEDSVEFYTKLFATKPTKIKPGYANFTIENPPLKLVLFEGTSGHSINHLGVEVDTKEEVSDAEQRLVAQGVDTTGVAETVCCYAQKTETWVEGPDGSRWEWYVKNADTDDASDRPATEAEVQAGTNACCPS